MPVIDLPWFRQGSTTVKTEDLHYDLPPELIAQQPCEPRDASRLMVVHRRTGRIKHAGFRDLLSLLSPQDCLVINKTQVVPARFAARRATGARIGGLFVREDGPGRWRVMLSNSRRLKPGERLNLTGSRWTMILGQRQERGIWEVEIDPPLPAAEALAQIGSMPLPPYIRRLAEENAEQDQFDRCRYQTVYAQSPGAVAAPTAGLHFTTSLLDDLKAKGVGIAEVLLHVGLGTFQPIEVDDLGDHDMHSEWYDLPSETVQRLNKVRGASGRIVAVGTTAVRVLESCSQGGALTAAQGWTNIFIYPPYTFRMTDALLTNFHLPASTLLALVCAFAGRDLVMRAYRAAVQERYRFYSYGDAMLIL